MQQTLCYPLRRQWSNGSTSATVYYFDDGSEALLGGAGALGQVYACGHLPCVDYGIDAKAMLATLRIAGGQLGFGNGYPSDNFDYAMAAARLGEPGLAADILMATVPANVYNVRNGVSILRPLGS